MKIFFYLNDFIYICHICRIRLRQGVFVGGDAGWGPRGGGGVYALIGLPIRTEGLGWTEK